jgi:hypothetical protein
MSVFNNKECQQLFWEPYQNHITCKHNHTDHGTSSVQQSTSRVLIGWRSMISRPTAAGADGLQDGLWWQRSCESYRTIRLLQTIESFVGRWPYTKLLIMPASCWIVCLIRDSLSLWRRRRHVPPKRLLTFNGLHTALEPRRQSFWYRITEQKTREQCARQLILEEYIVECKAVYSDTRPPTLRSRNVLSLPWESNSRPSKKK